MVESPLYIGKFEVYFINTIIFRWYGRRDVDYGEKWCGEGFR